MTPRLVDRIATLLKADAHGVVDALEERALLVKQCLREAELELLQKRGRLAALKEEARRLRDELERCREELLRLDEDVRLALTGGREELARFAIRRLLPKRELAGSLELRIAAVAETSARLTEKLAEQEEAYAELRSRARARLAERAQRPDACDWQGAPAVEEQEVELELLRRRGGDASDAEARR